MRHEYSEEGLPLRAHNLRPIEYHGIPHLVYTSVLETDALKDTTNINMNSSCAVVERIMRSGDHVESDPHEFAIIDNGTRVIQTRRIDYALPASSGDLLTEAVFQVVDISTRRVEFEWHSLDHNPVNESCLGFKHHDY